MKKYFTKEVIIGIISIISLSILYFGINYLKGINIFKPSNHYYIRFNNVKDLQKTSPVYVDGFKVGVVNDIIYNYSKPGNIVVEVGLDKNMRIQTGSYVELSSGLTTGASLTIMLNTYVSSFCHVGDTIDGNLKLGAMEQVTETLVPQIELMMPKIDSILTGLQDIVNHPALSASLNHIQYTSSNLEKTSASLNKMLDGDVRAIVSNFKVISSDLTEVSSGLKELDIQTTYNSINTTMSNIERLSNQFNNKDSNIGLLLNDRSLYDNLNKTTENASDLLYDLKQNPKRYVHFSIF